MKEQLIFVYNANSDLFSAVTDFAHKIISPSTYQCRLCALTYGNFSIKQDWKNFVENLPAKAVFLHKDEFEKQYKVKSALPSIFLTTDNAVHEIITKQQIESCPSLEELKNLISLKINEHVQHHHTRL